MYKLIAISKNGLENKSFYTIKECIDSLVINYRIDKTNYVVDSIEKTFRNKNVFVRYEDDVAVRIEKC